MGHYTAGADIGRYEPVRIGPDGKAYPVRLERGFVPRFLEPGEAAPPSRLVVTFSPGVPDDDVQPDVVA